MGAACPVVPVLAISGPRLVPWRAEHRADYQLLWCCSLKLVSDTGAQQPPKACKQQKWKC